MREGSKGVRGLRVCLGLAAVSFVGMSPATGAAAFSGIASPTSDWFVALTGSKYDASGDPQAAHGKNDLVGGVGRPLLYTYYNAASDQLNYRVRIGGTKTKGTGWSFDEVLMIALDYARVDTPGQPADYGKIDLFIVCDAGGPSTGVYKAGNLSNTSPNTTSIGPISGSSIAHAATNYNFTHVNPTIFNNGSYSNDIDANGGIDGFVSFSVPLSFVSSAANSLFGMAVGASTPVAYGLLTSTQSNAINADFGGIDDRLAGAGDTQWSALTTAPMSPTAVPEPGTVFSAGAVSLCALARRQRRIVTLASPMVDLDQ